jgi:hypothetical protein
MPPVWLSPKDQHDLDLLKTLFYAYAGFLAFSVLGLFVVGALMLLPVFMLGTSGRAAPHQVEILGGVVGVILLFALLVLTVKFVFMILGARAIAKRSGAALPLIAACLALTNIPIGTALGIYALTTLTKPQIKQALSTRAS